LFKVLPPWLRQVVEQIPYFAAEFKAHILFTPALLARRLSFPTNFRTLAFNFFNG
jgi:hypothetical protein